MNQKIKLKSLSIKEIMKVVKVNNFDEKKTHLETIIMEDFGRPDEPYVEVFLVSKE